MLVLSSINTLNVDFGLHIMCHGFNSDPLFAKKLLLLQIKPFGTISIMFIYLFEGLFVGGALSDQGSCPGLDPKCVEFACPPRVIVGFPHHSPVTCTGELDLPNCP